MRTYFETETNVVHDVIYDFFYKFDCHHRKELFIGRVLSEKKYGETLYAELNQKVETTTSSYSETGVFLQCIYSVLVAKNHQMIRSRCLVHEFFFTNVF